MRRHHHEPTLRLTGRTIVRTRQEGTDQVTNTEHYVVDDDEEVDELVAWLNRIAARVNRLSNNVK